MPTVKPRSITLRPHGRVYRILRADGCLYVATRSGEAWAGTWAQEDAVPAGASPDFTEAEARLLLHHLLARATGGRKAAPPEGQDGKLVARAMAATGQTQASLAAILDPPVSGSFLSKVLAGKRPLSDVQRAQLHHFAGLGTGPSKARSP